MSAPHAALSSLYAEYVRDTSSSSSWALNGDRYNAMLLYVGGTIPHETLAALQKSADRGGLMRELPATTDFTAADGVLKKGGLVVLPFRLKLVAIYEAAVAVSLQDPSRRGDGKVSFEAVCEHLKRSGALVWDATGQRSVFALQRALVEHCLLQEGRFHAVSVHFALMRLQQLWPISPSEARIYDSLTWKPCYPFAPASLPRWFHSLTDCLPGKVRAPFAAEAAAAAEAAVPLALPAATPASPSILVTPRYLPGVVDAVAAYLGGELAAVVGDLQLGALASGAVVVNFRCRYCRECGREGCNAALRVEAGASFFDLQLHGDPIEGGCHEEPLAILTVLSGHTAPCPYAESLPPDHFDPLLAIPPSARLQLLQCEEGGSKEQIFLKAALAADEEMQHLNNARRALTSTGRAYPVNLFDPSLMRAKRAANPFHLGLRVLHPFESPPLCLCGMPETAAAEGTEWVQCARGDSCSASTEGWYHVRCLRGEDIDDPEWVCPNCKQNMPPVLLRAGSAFVRSEEKTKRFSLLWGKVAGAALLRPGWGLREAVAGAAASALDNPLCGSGAVEEALGAGVAAQGAAESALGGAAARRGNAAGGWGGGAEGMGGARACLPPASVSGLSPEAPLCQRLAELCEGKPPLPVAVPSPLIVSNLGSGPPTHYSAPARTAWTAEQVHAAEARALAASTNSLPRATADRVALALAIVMGINDAAADPASALFKLPLLPLPKEFTASVGARLQLPQLQSLQRLFALQNKKKTEIVVAEWLAEADKFASFRYPLINSMNGEATAGAAGYLHRFRLSALNIVNLYSATSGCATSSGRFSRKRGAPTYPISKSTQAMPRSYSSTSSKITWAKAAASLTLFWCASTFGARPRTPSPLVTATLCVGTANGSLSTRSASRRLACTLMISATRWMQY